MSQGSFCTNCGETITDGCEYCSKCREPINEISEDMPLQKKTVNLSKSAEVTEVSVESSESAQVTEEPDETPASAQVTEEPDETPTSAQVIEENELSQEDKKVDLSKKSKVRQSVNLEKSVSVNEEWEESDSVEEIDSNQNIKEVQAVDLTKCEEKETSIDLSKVCKDLTDKTIEDDDNHDDDDDDDDDDYDDDDDDDDDDYDDDDDDNDLDSIIDSTYMNLGIQGKIALIVRKKVIDSYVNDRKIIYNELYQKGVMYNLSKDKVDELIQHFNGILEDYLSHLKNLYINGSMILLDDSKEVEVACVSYAGHIGLSSEEGESVYQTFLQRNNICKKHAILIKAVKSFSETGQLKLDHVICTDNPELKEELSNNELIRLQNAVDALMELQIKLLQVAQSYELNQDDYDRLYEEGMELGFVKKSDIEDCIDGNTERIKYEELFSKSVKEEFWNKNADMFAQCVSPAEFTIMGQKVYFESCYFVGNYTDDYFSEKINELKENTLQTFKGLDIKNSEKLFGMTLHLWQYICRWGSIVSDYSEQMGIKDDIYPKVKEYFKDDFSTFSNRIDEYVDMFKEHETELQEALNNGISEPLLDKLLQSILDKQADELDSLMKEVAEFFDMLIDETSNAFFIFLMKAYPYSFCVKEYFTNHESDEDNTIYQAFMRPPIGDEADAIQRIKINPYSEECYQSAISQIAEQDIRSFYNDFIQLRKIAELFDVDYLVRTACIPRFSDELTACLDSEDSEKKRETVQFILQTCASDKVLSNLALDVFKQYKSKAGKVTIDICDKLLYLETVSDDVPDYHKSVELQNKVYGRYLKQKVEEIAVFSVEEIKNMLDCFHEFATKNHYTSEDAEELFFNRFHDFCADAKDLNDLISLSQKIERLEKYQEDCSYDLQPYLIKLRGCYENVDSDLRRTEIIAKYDLSTGEFTMSEYIAPSINDKNLIQDTVENIKSKCRSISAKATKSDFDGILNQIHATNKNGACTESFFEDLKKQWEKEDVKLRTVEGVIYNTRDEAICASGELKFIRQVKERKDIDIMIKYKMLLEHSFTTEQARKEVLQEEKKLFDYMNSVSDKSQYRREHAGLPILAVIVSFITFIFVFINLFLGVVGVVVSYFCWVSYGNKLSEARSYNDNIPYKREQNNKEIARFNQLFLVVNGHIVINFRGYNKK